MEPIVLKPGDGEALHVAGNDVVIKAGGDRIAGRAAVVDYTAAPGFPGPPLHIHRELTDIFYVLEGTLTFRVGDETIEAPAGSFVLVPPGTAHTFSNPSEAPARFLGIVSPAGFEQYFRDLAAALGDGPLDPAVAQQIASRYDIEPAPEV